MSANRERLLKLYQRAIITKEEYEAQLADMDAQEGGFDIHMAVDGKVEVLDHADTFEAAIDRILETFLEDTDEPIETYTVTQGDQPVAIMAHVRHNADLAYGIDLRNGEKLAYRVAYLCDQETGSYQQTRAQNLATKEYRYIKPYPEG